MGKRCLRVKFCIGLCSMGRLEWPPQPAGHTSVQGGQQLELECTERSGDPKFFYACGDYNKKSTTVESPHSDPAVRRTAAA